MKYNKHILLPMTLALLSVTTSCEQEELSPTLPEGDFVEVRARIGSPETRVAQPKDNVYVFEDGDKIHIVSWYDADSYNIYDQLDKFENPEKPGTYLWWDDAVSTYSKSNDRWHTTPYLRWQNIDLDGNPNPHHCFLAWYPEDLVESNAVLTAIPVTVTGDIKKDDYMFARWIGQRPANDNVINLAFNHLMARFDLNLVFNSEDYTTTPTDISAKIEVVKTATIDLLADSPAFTLGSTKTEVSLKGKSSPAEGMAWSGYTVVIPGQDINAFKVTLSFTADGKQKSLTYTHGGSLLFQSGKRTVLNLTVNKSDVKPLEGQGTDTSGDHDFGGRGANERRGTWGNLWE